MSGCFFLKHGVYITTVLHRFICQQEITSNLVKRTFQWPCFEFLHRFRDIIAYFPKVKEVTWQWPCPFQGRFVVRRWGRHTQSIYGPLDRVMM